MTTTGYGDISASNEYEAAFTAFSMIVGGSMFAYSFNSIGIIVDDLNKSN